MGVHMGGSDAGVSSGAWHMPFHSNMVEVKVVDNGIEDDVDKHMVDKIVAMVDSKDIHYGVDTRNDVYPHAVDDDP